MLADDYVLNIITSDIISFVEDVGELKRAEETIVAREKKYRQLFESSFGIAIFPYHADDMTNLLTAADHALFDVKDSGKDNIKLYR